MRHKRWFWAAIALQVLVLLGMVGRHGYTLATGMPVMLKTVPVDPWDPLRGEYVTLRYEISTLTPGQIAMTGAPYRRGQSVWVLLQSQGEFWGAVKVSDRTPAAVSGQVPVQATVEYDSSYTNHPGEVVLRYGIEQFYVPEGEGRGIEQGRANLTVEAMVDSFGRPALRRVYLAGKEIRWR